MKQLRNIVLIIISVLMLGGCTDKKANDKKEVANIDPQEIVFQVIKSDYRNEDNSVNEERKVKVGDEIILSDNQDYHLYGKTPNTIKILKITDDEVTIARNQKCYEIINSDEPSNKKYRDYVKYVEDSLKYGQQFSICIDDNDPYSPDYSQARYDYYGVFEKID